MAEASKYFLTEEQLRAEFDLTVQRYVFDGYQPQPDQPVLVLLGAQPAAGKSQAMQATQRAYEGADLVPLTGDELRSLHPRYDELRREGPQTFETGTAQASGPWVRMSIDYALKNRYSLVLEGVFRDPAMTISTAERFAAAGFRVEIVALGVREERSRLDALHRFLTPGTGLPGRWTPPELQDLSYRMMPETVAAAEASAIVQRITITNRTGADLYVNERSPDGRWRSAPAAVQALQSERARPLPATEAQSWLSRYQQVIVTFAGEGRVDEASGGVLQRLTADADAVVAMAYPDPRSPSRSAHEAAQRLLRGLASGPLPAGQPLPLSFQTDEEIAQRRLHLTAAVQSAEGAAQRAEGQMGSLVQRLTDQGAPPERVNRARTSLHEDQEHARQRGTKLRHQLSQVSAEQERRRQLPSAHQQVESGIRAQVHAAHPVLAQQPHRQSATGPRLDGPQHPGPRRGLSQ
ncbi:zeta toxin family protein [Streptomyces sp. NPDC056231]|uniref:zeta toxin family protein n=1 Tax=Streptomyces sp. NPDC056231 TaxID=3345755 RepID=UPI003AB06BA0